MNLHSAARDLRFQWVRLAQGLEFVLAIRPGQDRYFAPFLKDHGVWEPAETALLVRGLEPGMNVVDVGAHVGYFTVLAAIKVGDKGAVAAFEPDPEHFRLLCANLLLNRCDNVKANRLAISNQPASGRLYLSAVNPGDHRIFPVPNRPSVNVHLDALDNIVRDRVVDFIKIDTQGAEYRVLSGANKTIQRSRDRLAGVMEFAPGLMARANCSVDDFVDLLLQHGAHIHEISFLEGSAALKPMKNPRDSLHRFAHSLLRTGQEDESGNLFVTFSELADQRWMRLMSIKLDPFGSSE